MSKFYIYTFGCRCNQADSAALRESLRGCAMEESRRSDEADLIVVNSCTVTRRTDQQVRQAARRLHRDNPTATVVVTGCYAERDPEAVAKIEGVRLVVGNADRDRLAGILGAGGNGPAAGIFHAPLDAAAGLAVPSVARTGGKTRPLVKIQDGCDAGCSYCIVPSVRGPGRSAPPEEILREIRSLAAMGFQEVVLTGVHLGSYGRKLTPPVRLSGLLQRVLEIPGLGRLRLSSIEPMRFERDIVRLAKKYRSFARHFHIPLQSGSDRILRRMRRPHSAARFLDLARFIAGEVPDVGLGSDVLVGFPGETDRDFQETCDLVRQAPLSYLHVFPFSSRPGTDASAMPDRIHPGVIRERTSVMRRLSQAKNLAFRRRFLGRELPAITLAMEERLESGLVVTDNYIHARVADLQVPPNRLLTVRLVEAQPERTTAVVA
ncbi:MAG: tRNA (N(6)-L-threonylcarbamoyladenosine(37)-C(2))-methylthiotransferase MtaB [Acidobacteria bacterium]|nr:tRNA (N(6)-L-threonylcarbamoyladenosine(37)-C(2))-methylthiotransferase MtaB [Acidobacteriota bacterium]